MSGILFPEIDHRSSVSRVCNPLSCVFSARVKPVHACMKQVASRATEPARGSLTVISSATAPQQRREVRAPAVRCFPSACSARQGSSRYVPRSDARPGATPDAPRTVYGPPRPLQRARFLGRRRKLSTTHTTPAHDARAADGDARASDAWVDQRAIGGFAPRCGKRRPPRGSGRSVFSNAQIEGYSPLTPLPRSR